MRNPWQAKAAELENDLLRGESEIDILTVRNMRLEARVRELEAELAIAALPDEPQDVDCNCPGFCTGKHND